PAEQRPSCCAVERRDTLVSTWSLPALPATTAWVMSALSDDSPFSQAAVLSGGAGSALDRAGAGLADGAGALVAGDPAAALAGAGPAGAGPADGPCTSPTTSSAITATGVAAPTPRMKPTSRLPAVDKTSRPGAAPAGDTATGGTAAANGTA